MRSRLAWRAIIGSSTRLPAIGAVDVAGTRGAAFQHAEPVEQKQRVEAGAVEMPVPGGALLRAMGRADRTVHVQHDVLQPVAIMETIDPLAIQSLIENELSDLSGLCFCLFE